MPEPKIKEPAITPIIAKPYFHEIGLAIKPALAAFLCVLEVVALDDAATEEAATTPVETNALLVETTEVTDEAATTPAETKAELVEIDEEVDIFSSVLVYCIRSID